MFLGCKNLAINHLPLERDLAVQTWTSNHKSDGKALVTWLLDVPRSREIPKNLNLSCLLSSSYILIRIVHTENIEIRESLTRAYKNLQELKTNEKSLNRQPQKVRPRAVSSWSEQNAWDAQMTTRVTEGASTGEVRKKRGNGRLQEVVTNERF